MTEEQIKALAAVLSKDVMQKSIMLEMGKSQGKEWAALCRAFNVRGYSTVEETETHLGKMFGVKK